MFEPKPINLNIRANLKNLFVEEVINNCPNLAPGKSRKNCLLILDDRTSLILDQFISMVSLIEAGVIGIERLSLKRKQFLHFHAMYFVEPTDENIELIKKDFPEPSSAKSEKNSGGEGDGPLYNFVHLVFTGPVSDSQIQSLSSNPRLVAAMMSIRQMSLDIFAVDENLYTLNFPKEERLFTKEVNEKNAKTFEDLATQSMSIFTLLQKVTYVQLVYEPGTIGESFAELMKPKVQFLVDQVSGTKLSKDEYPPVFFVIVHRAFDLVTPLLRDGSYAGQFFHFLEREEHTIEGKHIGQNEEVTTQMDPLNENDPIWLNFKYKNFGEASRQINEAFKAYFQKVSKSSNGQKKKENLEDEVRELPQLRETIHDFTKHIEAFSKISAKKLEIKFEEVFKLEQGLATGKKRNGEPLSVANINRSELPLKEDQLRLALIARLAQNSDADVVADALFDPKDKESKQTFKQLLAFFDKAKLSDFGKLQTDEDFDPLKTQYYRPRADELLHALVKGKLADLKNSFQFKTIDIYPKNSSLRPFEKNCFKGNGGLNAKDQSPVVAFLFLGGVSYAECAALSAFQESKGSGDFKLLLGGTSVNSSFFLMKKLLALVKEKAQPSRKSSE